MHMGKTTTDAIQAAVATKLPIATKKRSLAVITNNALKKVFNSHHKCTENRECSKITDAVLLYKPTAHPCPERGIQL